MLLIKSFRRNMEDTRDKRVLEMKKNFRPIY